jgi:hypothetical protein
MENFIFHFEGEINLKENEMFKRKEEIFFHIFSNSKNEIKKIYLNGKKVKFLQLNENYIVVNFKNNSYSIEWLKDSFNGTHSKNIENELINIQSFKSTFKTKLSSKIKEPIEHKLNSLWILSNKNFNELFKILSEHFKNIIRVEFGEKVKNKKNNFPNLIKVVTDSDHSIYDEFDINSISKVKKFIEKILNCDKLNSNKFYNLFFNLFNSILNVKENLIKNNEKILIEKFEKVFPEKFKFQELKLKILNEILKFDLIEINYKKEINVKQISIEL